MASLTDGIYQRIDGDRYRHIYAVGDLHGCYSLLMKKIQQVDFDKEKDLIISVGDLIDRGEQSVECLDLLNEKWFKAVRGNHEEMAISALKIGDANNWIYNGGQWFFMLDYEKEILAKACLKLAEKLPLIIELNVNNKKIIIAHADYPDDEYEFGKEINEIDVVWSRDRISKKESRDIKGADLFIFGHTPLIKGIWRRSNQEYIDTGAVFGHELTLKKIK
ncbi:metallophosphoesterase [Arsenophonus sp.]|uniref:metallophosphoesterase n=1 Tax=Arsenophonus sp. TaxID=1872640 RepID=UPI0028566460|nr:metallophosphoesterase [Arsenophonus sp.]MDR5616827.1 metallophosphoesterase [Arsenophonus sp.]MDR5618309.1 metallophosphoesterase [Arsenophonus sp.]